MKYRSRVVVWAVLLLVSAVVIAAEVVVCRACGYERKPGAATCGHCGASFEEPKPPVAAQEGPLGVEDGEHRFDEAGMLIHVGDTLIEGEIERGRQHYHEGETDVALLYFENAAALNLLGEPGSEAARGKQLVGAMERCREREQRSRVKCTKCGGSGKGTMEMTSLSGEVVARETAGRTCSNCKGRGFVLRGLGIDEVKRRLARSAERYRMLQQARKYIPVGGAWIPQELEDKLSVRQTASLRRSTAGPCPDCMGLGEEDCEECHGTGALECPNDDCQNGKVRVESEGTLSRLRVHRTEPCKTCDAKGKVACQDCKGRGSVLCGECGGTGDRVECRRCGAQGFSACRRCNGAGRYKDADCAACGGHGVVLCSSCNGDGRGRR